MTYSDASTERAARDAYNEVMPFEWDKLEDKTRAIFIAFLERGVSTLATPKATEQPLDHDHLHTAWDALLREIETLNRSTNYDPHPDDEINVSLTIAQANALEAAADAVLTAKPLSTTPKAWTPVGLKLVPVEPTEKMVMACRSALKQHIESTPENQRTWRRGSSGQGGYDIPGDEKAKVRYRAMIKAAPEPEIATRWQPVGWNGPFRATMGEVVDVVGKFVCHTGYEEAAEIASALNTALARAVSEWRPTLQAALDRIDAADKECPVRQSKRSVEKCPKCSATTSDGCGLNVRALHSLEADIRSLLSPPPPETGGVR